MRIAQVSPLYEAVPPRLYGQQQAGADGLPVELHRAGAADAVLAADVGAGQPRLVADEVGEEQAGLDRALVGDAVDLDRHGSRVHAAPVARPAAFSSARRTITSTRPRR